MALVFMTANPKKLLNDFDARIAQHEASGKITTWERDKDGDYTHKSDNWAKKAWFRPVVGLDRLTFNIIKPKNVNNITSPVYSYYHGHLLETFLNHFDTQFSNGSATANCTSSDMCYAA